MLCHIPAPGLTHWKGTVSSVYIGIVKTEVPLIGCHQQEESRSRRRSVPSSLLVLSWLSCDVSVKAVGQQRIAKWNFLLKHKQMILSLLHTLTKENLSFARCLQFSILKPCEMPVEPMVVMGIGWDGTPTLDYL